MTAESYRLAIEKDIFAIIIRPRFQRALLDWLEERRPHFSVQPRVVRRTDQRLYLNFDGVNPIVEVEASRDKVRSEAGEYVVCVWLCFGNSYVDQLFCSSARVRRLRSGYVNAACGVHAQKLYPTREALWRDVLFEPFLDWANGKLAKSSAIAAGHSLVESIEVQYEEGVNKARPTGESHWIYDWMLVDCEAPIEMLDFNLILLRSSDYGPSPASHSEPTAMSNSG